MPRRILTLCGLLPALAFPAMAQASDSSLIHALSPYKNALTADVITLATLEAPPAKSAVPSWTSKLQKAQSDFATVARVARGQTASTSTGRKAQSEVLSALSYAYGAAGDGLAAMTAVRQNNGSAAKTDIANERVQVARSLTPFSEAGKTLGLFNG